MGSTRDRVLERAAFFTGQKSGLPPKTLQATDCEVVQNMLPKRGILQKVFGDSTYGTLGGSGRIYWLDKLHDLWVAQRGTELFSESAEDAGTFLTVGTGLTAAVPQTDIYRGELYLVNGIDQKICTVATQKNLGLQAPLSASALNNISGAGNDFATATSGGSFTDNGIYKITLTLYDPLTNVESPGLNVRPNAYGLCSDLAPDYWTVTFGASGAANDNSVTINQSFIDALYANTYNSTTLIDATRATYIRVYTTGISTGVAASIFRLATEVIKPTSGGITITAPATGVLFPDSNIPPPNSLRQQEAYFTQYALTPPASVGASVYKSIRFFRDSLFAVGATGLQYSSDYSSSTAAFDSILYIHEPFQPDYVFDTREVSNGDGQKATAVAVLRDSVLVVLKERSTYYLSGTSADSYVVRVMDTRRGALSANTVQETPYGIFALDRSGVIQISVVGPTELISGDIEDVIDTINFSAISTAYSAYDAKESRYYLCVPVDGAVTPNKTLVYKVDEKAWSTLNGQEGSAMRFQVSSTNQARTLIGSESTGRLARVDQEGLVTINGTGQIDMQYTSGPFYGGDPTRKKKAKFVYITAESATSWDFYLEVIPDFGQSQSFLANDGLVINSDSLYAVWAASLADAGALVGVWDQSSWGAVKTRKQLKVPVSCVGYTFQIKIVNNSTDATQYGFRLLSLELESVMMGK